MGVIFAGDWVSADMTHPPVSLVDRATLAAGDPSSRLVRPVACLVAHLALPGGCIRDAMLAPVLLPELTRSGGGGGLAYLAAASRPIAPDAVSGVRLAAGQASPGAVEAATASELHALVAVGAADGRVQACARRLATWPAAVDMAGVAGLEGGGAECAACGNLGHVELL